MGDVKIGRVIAEVRIEAFGQENLTSVGKRVGEVPKNAHLYALGCPGRAGGQTTGLVARVGRADRHLVPTPGKAPGQGGGDPRYTAITPSVRKIGRYVQDSHKYAG